MEQPNTNYEKEVRIVDFEQQYKKAYRDLNVAWISQYFEMEPSDFKALDSPEAYILEKGGRILVALINDEPVGVCALIRQEEGPFDFEMAKMAVAPEARGKHIGWRLGKKIIETAKAMGGKVLYLESNTILEPAIKLYRKLGFEEVTGYETPYKRCNIQMQYDLTKQV
ncbi:GNAT family N-acetyltransferase [Robertkochia solimangrovi]|uniref:GNAT family N-acetyltransferase n=1 Tax=Robertkochia solimangrovi TaxID=2213046 RepID=UPI00117BFB45|nr:GNAT family N-acetyltransferase [Robertkochia solimangrovi]TRZ41586.1 hypothetical protein DMZ48_16380 [Robertkochia solimangrovi]